MDENFGSYWETAVFDVFVELCFGQSVVGVNVIRGFSQNLLREIESRFNGTVFVETVVFGGKVLKGKMGMSEESEEKW